MSRRRKLQLISAATFLFLPSLALAEDPRSEASALFGVVAPITPEEKSLPQVVLGRALFWDERLSSSGKVSCASCHAADAWGADVQPQSIDARGKLTKRHSQTVFNAQGAEAGQRWIGDRATGADQAKGSVTGSMGFEKTDELILKLGQFDYTKQFQAAYPDQKNPLTVENYAAALQSYQETLRTPAAFDRWLQGDDRALNPQQRRGLRHFIDVGCANCHSGAQFGGGMLQKFGIYEDYRVLTGSTGADVGLMEKTGNDDDRDVFRVQPLRNATKTAPYFHDGSVKNLAQAVSIMAKAQLGQPLTPPQIADIVAFLGALSGAVPDHYRPVIAEQSSSGN